MTQINNLPTRKLTAGDVFPFFSTNNGDAAKASMTTLAKLIGQLLGISNSPAFVSQYAAPSANDFEITVNSTSASTWLIITPTVVALNGGTIVLPAVDSVGDGQELMIVSNMDIAFTIDPYGASISYETTGLQIGGSLRIKFDAVMKRWYFISLFREYNPV